MIKSHSGFLQYTFLTMLLLFALTTSVYAEKQVITLAYLKKGLDELQNNERQIALQLLANELIRETDLLMPVMPVESLPEIQRLVTAEKLDLMIFNSYHFISHYDFFQHQLIEPIWAIQRGPQERENFIVLSSTRYAKQPLEAFRDKTLSINPQYILMNFYLKFIVKQVSHLDVTDFFKRIKHTRTASQAVLDVYFGKSDLCIVPEYIFDLAVELNPAMRKKVIVVHESGHLFYPVLAFGFKYVDQSMINLTNANLSVIGQNPRGEKILDMFHIQAIKQVTLEQLQPMRQLFINYQALSQQ